MADNQLVTGPAQRQCGDCSLCCCVFVVPELNKLAGEWCCHCSSKGCSIYDSRPAVCANYECLWLHCPERVPEEFRPDRTGVVINEFAEADLPIIELHETYHGAADRICDRVQPARSQGLGILIYYDGQPHTAIPPILVSDADTTRWLDRFWKRLEERRRIGEAGAQQIQQQRRAQTHLLHRPTIRSDGTTPANDGQWKA